MIRCGWSPRRPSRSRTLCSLRPVGIQASVGVRGPQRPGTMDAGPRRAACRAPLGCRARVARASLDRRLGQVARQPAAVEATRTSPAAILRGAEDLTGSGPPAVHVGERFRPRLHDALFGSGMLSRRKAGRCVVPHSRHCLEWRVASGERRAASATALTPDVDAGATGGVRLHLAEHPTGDGGVSPWPRRRYFTMCTRGCPSGQAK
jgi:hypothetical protein